MVEFPIDIISLKAQVADINYHFRSHTHNFWQFYYVHEGDVEMVMPDKSYLLAKGDSLLIPPGLERSPRCFSLPPKYLYALFNNISLDLEGAVQTVLHTKPAQQIRFNDVFDELDFPKDRNSTAFMYSTIISLIVELRRSVQHHQPQCKEYYLEIISRLDTYMQCNLHLPLRRKDLAHIAHVSSPHLARIYHKYLQTTPLGRLTQLRMQHAQLLLSQSTQPITIVSAEVGYESISHFSRTFRRYSGQSPREYRKEFLSGSAGKSPISLETFGPEV